jgi:transposase
MKIALKNPSPSKKDLQKIVFLLQQEIANQKDQITSQQNEINTYKNRYALLLEQIRLERSRHFSSSSEKNTLQPDLFDEAGIELSEEVKAQLADTVEIASHVRNKHPVRKPLPTYIPREIILHDVPENERICGCGEALVRIGEETCEQLNYVPAQIRVIRHVRPKYACKPCQGSVKIAGMPKLLLPKSLATPELIAHILISKYADHLPLYRQEAMWKRLEIDLPRSSLCGWVLKTADICAPLIQQLQKQVVNYDYVQADETTVQVLAEVGRDNRTKSYMWAYRGGGYHPSIVYEYQETRGGHHAREFLTGFKGFLQSDAYAGYNWAQADAGIVAVACHAHARRGFADIAKANKTPGLAQEALHFYRKLYAVEKTARENELAPEARFKLRQEKSIPILEAFKQWLDHHVVKTAEQSPLGKAMRYALTHWPKLLNYLKDGRIEIDNNLIENAIRPFALGRKNWLFNGSPAGAKAGATFFSLIETCKANHLDPYRYLCTMLNRIRDCVTQEDYKKLLPQFITLEGGGVG